MQLPHYPIWANWKKPDTDPPTLTPLFTPLLSNEQRGRLEKIVAENAKASLAYAIGIGHRFEPGEPVILTDPESACTYAIEVIKARWPEAEHIISTTGKTSYRYFEAQSTRDEVSPEIHESIERFLLKQKGHKKIAQYAMMLGGPLPQNLHNKMILQGNKGYAKFLKKKEAACIRYLNSLNHRQIKDLLARL